MNDDTPRIEGIPSKGGAYWYYKRGKLLPSLVLIGTRNGERVINDGPAMQRFWYPGEFFVGPIEPPFATPDDLAGRKYGEELYLQEAVGTAVSDQR
ncbi:MULTISPECIES: hypothetical protein [Mycetohabitans]|uniref:hypothetical protein n=1 Tax=Mycetohabitans TaxID=2571159 RepID=UPI001F3484FA|nr:hypothetical protein [Mycetohabitans sp. B3]MCF2135584.1 hypothetical protein [Mycetohabitans sp. B3]